jgi:hypothetical protein
MSRFEDFAVSAALGRVGQKASITPENPPSTFPIVALQGVCYIYIPNADRTGLAILKLVNSKGLRS